MPQNSDEQRALEVLSRGWQIVPCPLLSRERRVWASAGAADGVVLRASGRGAAWHAEATDGGAWVALQVGVGPARALVVLGAPEDERVLRAYRLETAAGDGRGGPWRVELEVADNGARVRAHELEFEGQSAVRVVFTAPPGAQLALERLDVHDVSDGTDDVWLALGSELAAAALAGGGVGPGFAQRINERYPGYFPVLIDAWCAGETPAETLARLEPLLEEHPEARRAALAYGGLDGSVPEPRGLAELVAALVASGRVPLLARAPRLEASRRAAADAFDAEVVRLEAAYGLAPGPLGVAAGSPPSSAPWADAADVFYVPQ